MAVQADASLVGLGHLKELQSIKPLKNRQGILRYDILPFILLYAADFIVAASYAAKYQW